MRPTWQWPSIPTAIVSLVLAGVAYCRSGGRRDMQRFDSQLQRQFDALQMKQAELVEQAAQSLAAAYDRSRQRLEHARARLHDLHTAAEQGLEAQRRRAAEHLEALGERLEHSRRRQGRHRVRRPPGPALL